MKLTTNAGMTVAGASAPITVTANGTDSIVSVSGYPITFSNGAVTLQSKGTSDHQVLIQYAGTFSGSNGLTMSGNGAVLIDASGMTSNDAGGQIHVYVDQATITAAPSFIMHADGVGTGAGGFIVFQPTKVVSLSSATATITANGVNGTVEFQPNGGSGAASITSTTFGITANAPAAGGNAGSIYFYENPLTLGASTKASLKANGPTAGLGNGGTINVSPGTITQTLKLGTNAGDLQVLANGGSTGGNGGNVFMNPSGNISIDTANAVSASVPGTNGNGGTVSLYPQGLSVTSSAATSINVDGKGTGNGGTINLQGSGTLNLGSTAGLLSLSARNNGGTGNGGTINIGYVTTLNVAGTLSVAGGTGAGSAAAGGTINLHDLGQLKVSGTIKADGGGSGLAGSISLYQTGSSFAMDLDNATITSSGDSAGSGSGNNIDISSSSTNIFMAGAKLHADAKGNGTSFGGSIHVTSGTSLDSRVDLSQLGTILSAVGATNGAGGNAIINNVASFDVNTVIKVDAGSGTLGNTGIFDGIIQLNGAECRQWHTGYTWPTAYWNCVNPTVPTATDQIPASVASNLPNGLSTSTLQPVNPYLYVLVDQAQFATFFGATLAPKTAGYTFSFGGKTRPLYTAIFENADVPGIGYGSLSTQWLNETTTHEMGHSIDASNLITGLVSATSAYTTGFGDDDQYLNGAGGGSPCTVGVGYAQGPFVGVVDFQTRAQFCTGAVLNNPGGIYTDPSTGHLYNNSGIAHKSTQNLNSGTFLGQVGDVEPYAQIFAYRAYASGESYPSGYYDTTVDGLLHQNFYQCAQKYAATLLNQIYNPAYACN